MIRIKNISKQALISAIIAIALWGGQKADAQQDPMYAQYHFNGLVINPAYAGTHEVLSATLLYRNQWVNMPGAPTTFTFSADAPFRRNKFGIGVSLMSDKIGITNRNTILGIYSYKVQFQSGTLALGLQVGCSFLSTNYSKVKYAYKNQSSDNAFAANFSDVYPNIGIGAYYYSKRFYAGVSMPQFVNKSMLKNFISSTESYNYDQANHFFITSGYVLDINSDVKLKPSILIKYVRGASPQIDINATAWLFDTFGLGTSYRSFNSINAYTEVKVMPQLFFGYAYEYSLSALHNYNSGSHEIMLRYDFDFAHPRVITPRYF